MTTTKMEENWCAHSMPPSSVVVKCEILTFPAISQPCQMRATSSCASGGDSCLAIDGKVLRRSFDRASGKSPLHMVSAWGSEQRLVLAQIATDAKSNEITAVPALLRMLALKGTIVTADALNCATEMFARLRGPGATGKTRTRLAESAGRSGQDDPDKKSPRFATGAKLPWFSRVARAWLAASGGVAVGFGTQPLGGRMAAILRLYRACRGRCALG